MSRRRNRTLRVPERAHAPVFAALGDPTRLFLVGTLSRGQPHSIAELTEGFDLTRQAVTKHLRVLENAGLVRGVREGREIRFELTPAPIEHVRRHLERVSQQWGDALSRLKAFVETAPGKSRQSRAAE